MPFSPIPDALAALKDGRMIIVVDNADRENEGDLIVAAEHVSEEQMTFIIRHTSGIVFLALSNAVADQLSLPPMVALNTSTYGTPFTVSIEAAQGVGTGVSAKDRVRTIRTAIAPETTPADLNRPGHIFPLRAQDGGVLMRGGHTEASVDLLRLAGLRAGAAGAELMRDDGTMMRLPDLEVFAREHDLPIVSIADLIAYRYRNECFVERSAEADLETDTGLWHLIVHRDIVHDQEHVTLTKGTFHAHDPILVRVHSECFTGDVLHSIYCDCRWQLTRAMEMIAQEGKGVLVYMKQEGRGIGLANKIRAYELQQKEGLDTVEANEKLGLPVDLRDYGIGAQILRDVGVGKMRLLTNNPKKMSGMEGFGLEVTEQLPIVIDRLSPQQRKYLETKKSKLGHILHL